MMIPADQAKRLGMRSGNELISRLTGSQAQVQKKKKKFQKKPISPTHTQGNALSLTKLHLGRSAMTQFSLNIRIKGTLTHKH